MATRDVMEPKQIAPTFSGSYYCDPKIFEKEWEKIFHRAWLCVGRENNLSEPGDFMTVQVGPENILITRDKEGHLGAFYNVCRHRGTRLCTEAEGHLEGAIRCPYHRWTYALDGRLIGTPHLQEGNGFAREDFSLYPVGVEVWGGFIFVNLDDNPQPLALQLGNLPDYAQRYRLAELKTARRLENDVEANWKILLENYEECYHCPGTHPELCELVPLYAKGPVLEGEEEGTPFRDGVATFTLSGTTRRPLFADLSEWERGAYNATSIPPNVMLYLMPDFVATRTLWPVSPTRTHIVTEWLFEPSTMAREDFDPSDAVEAVQTVARQDWQACERVQLGVGSRAFEKGGVCIPGEGGLSLFKDWLLKALEAKPGDSIRPYW